MTLTRKAPNLRFGIAVTALGVSTKLLYAELG